MAETAQAPVTYNQDVLSLYNLFNAFLKELHRCESSGTNEVNDDDYNRMESYLNALKGQRNWIMEEPRLDLPKTGPKEYLLPEAYNPDLVSNQQVNNMMRMMATARDELVLSSESSRRSSGLDKFDLDRFDRSIKKMESYLGKFIKEFTPLDLPESSPRAASSGPGNTGI